MIIYWIRAQAPRRVLALAKHLGVAAEFVELDLMGGCLREAAYAALNPNMKAPTLVDGDLVLWESSAIMIGAPDIESLKSKVADFVKFAKVLDSHLAARRHVACGRLTVADFQLASMASYWRESEMPMGAFPNIVRWIETLVRIPAWADPWPNKALA
jgi:glutathione S-transferase